jgi:hypothetical protein
MRTLYNLIIYSGVVAVILLVATFVLGITELNFKLHKILGVLTFIFAMLHGTLVLYRMLKIKLSQSLFRS